MGGCQGLAGWLAGLPGLGWGEKGELRVTVK